MTARIHDNSGETGGQMGMGSDIPDLSRKRGNGVAFVHKLPAGRAEVL